MAAVCHNARRRGCADARRFLAAAQRRKPAPKAPTQRESTGPDACRWTAAVSTASATARPHLLQEELDHLMRERVAAGAPAGDLAPEGAKQGMAAAGRGNAHAVAVACYVLLQLRTCHPSQGVTRLLFGKEMLETAVEISVAASAPWRLLTDTTRWREWGPSVSRVECAERYIGLGSTGRVQTVIGLWLPFRITELSDGHRWFWEVAGIPATGHRVEALGPDRCRVVFEVPWLAAPYLAVCRLAARRIRRILENE